MTYYIINAATLCFYNPFIRILIDLNNNKNNISSTNKNIFIATIRTLDEKSNYCEPAIISVFLQLVYLKHLHHTPGECFCNDKNHDSRHLFLSKFLQQMFFFDKYFTIITLPNGNILHELSLIHSPLLWSLIEHFTKNRDVLNYSLNIYINRRTIVALVADQGRHDSKTDVSVVLDTLKCLIVAMCIASSSTPLNPEQFSYIKNNVQQENFSALASVLENKQKEYIQNQITMLQKYGPTFASLMTLSSYDAAIKNVIIEMLIQLDYYIDYSNPLNKPLRIIIGQYRLVGLNK